MSIIYGVTLGMLGFFTVEVSISFPVWFYCTMHYSAKRCLAITCRLSIHLSVCLSATLVDHDCIGWMSWKLIVWTFSPASSLFLTQRSCTYSQGTWMNFGENRCGVGKSGMLEHKSSNISEMARLSKKTVWRSKEETWVSWFFGSQPYFYFQLHL